MIWQECAENSRLSLKGNGCCIQASCQVLDPLPKNLVLGEELFAVPHFVMRRWAFDDMPPAGKLRGWELGSVVLGPLKLQSWS